MKYIKKHWPLILLTLFMLYGGYLRLRGLSTNYSFWMDEDHVGVMVRRLNTQGLPYLFDLKNNSNLYQLGLYLFDSLSIKIFGFNEFALRLPLVLFGVLTIWAAYLLGKELFNKSTGLIASFLTAFLQIQILWSRQARPYQGLQLCYILAVYFIYRLITKTGSKKWNLIGFLGVGLLGASLHGLGALIIPIGLISVALFGGKRYWKEIVAICLITIITVAVYHINIKGLITTVGKFNNSYYYRVFLTHNYLSLCIFAVIGTVGLIINKQRQQLLLLLLFSLPQIFVVSFILPQPFIRYIFIIMPFLYILVGYGITKTGEMLDNISLVHTYISHWFISPRGISNISPGLYLFRRYLVSLILFVMLVTSLVVSDKLILTPRPYYSLNEDMLEVPEVDWKGIYRVVSENNGGSEEVPLVTNWSTTPMWYMGEDANTHLTRVAGDTEIITSVDKLKGLIDRYPVGLVVLDSWDNLYPPEVLQYCRDNMQLIYENDRLYPVQPRYWTVWVWRWDTD